MTVRTYSPKITWSSGDVHPQMLRELDRVLREWDGTSYESGQRFKGRAADCIGAVFGVVDELDGRERAAYPGMPRDSAMHDRPGAIAAMRELVRRYAPCSKVKTDVVNPGDIVVTGEPGGGPGHVAIVGARRNELWQATPGSGFHQGGWGMFVGQVLYAVYRIEDKHRWI